jgi:hypothetical protein
MILWLKVIGGWYQHHGNTSFVKQIICGLIKPTYKNELISCMRIIGSILNLGCKHWGLLLSKYKMQVMKVGWMDKVIDKT